MSDSWKLPPCVMCGNAQRQHKSCQLCGDLYCYSLPWQKSCYGKHDCFGYDDYGQAVLG